jgi:hypothetical protein
MNCIHVATVGVLLLLGAAARPGEPAKGDKPLLKDDHKKLVGVWEGAAVRNDKEENTVKLEFASGSDFLASGRGRLYKYLKPHVEAGWDIVILEVTKKRKDVVAGEFTRQAWPFKLQEKGKDRVVAVVVATSGAGKDTIASVKYKLEGDTLRLDGALQDFLKTDFTGAWKRSTKK